MVFAGYADNHSADSYCMWHSSTQKITDSHDVIWLHKMFYQDTIGDDVAILPVIRVKYQNGLMMALWNCPMNNESYIKKSDI